MKAIGLLGGTFDPIHYGHLRIALEVRQALDLASVRFIPCAHPPHREPANASFMQRVKMLELAIETEPAFGVDDREQDRPGPSYTFDTMVEIRTELGKNVSLCLIVGSDAFVEFDTWHRWSEILDLVNIIIVHRPGVDLLEQDHMEKLLKRHVTYACSDLNTHACGKIFSLNVTSLDISATLIRSLISHRDTARYLLPDSVLETILEKKLYSE